jgi:hypothetical protein
MATNVEVGSGARDLFARCTQSFVCCQMESDQAHSNATQGRHDQDGRISA